ncbi:tRNA (adenine-N1)-methyltransferase [bacterium]|nr:tRNA (adenine-N1)-methyltransferase [bacterium]
MDDKITENSLILIIDVLDNSKRYLVPIERGKFSTKRGEIDLTELVGRAFGTVIESHLGRSYAAVRPTFYDRIMRGIKRRTQIIYPKDSGYIALWLGLRDGMKVFECGTGSGVMTSIMANAVAPDGVVITYERDEFFFELAKSNIEKLGFANNVEMFNRELADGIDYAPYDAMFIDFREPWEHIDIIWSALAGGAPVAFVLPTTNQVSMLLQFLTNGNKFIDINVAETLLRFYKPVPARLRPNDRMVAHTTYLIMARKIITD